MGEAIEGEIVSFIIEVKISLNRVIMKPKRETKRGLGRREIAHFGPDNCRLYIKHQSLIGERYFYAFSLDGKTTNFGLSASDPNVLLKTLNGLPHCGRAQGPGRTIEKLIIGTGKCSVMDCLASIHLDSGIFFITVAAHERTQFVAYDRFKHRMIID
jgi:hypothetical protein